MEHLTVAQMIEMSKQYDHSNCGFNPQKFCGCGQEDCPDCFPGKDPEICEEPGCLICGNF